MDSPEKLARLNTQDKGWRQANKKQTKHTNQQAKTMSKTDPQ
jgi:hypothetical protein